MKRSSCRSSPLALIPLALLLACSSSEQVHLLPPSAQDAGDSVTEAERLSRLQKVRVVTHDGTTVSVGEWLPEAVISEVDSDCGFNEMQRCPQFRDPCNACSTEVLLCTAQRLLELASLRSKPFVITKGPTRYEIGQQSTATNAAIAARAVKYAGMAIAEALKGLKTTETRSSSGADSECTTATALWRANGDSDPPLVGPLLAHDLVDATHVLREASTVAVDGTLAVADAQLSEPAIGRRVQYGITAPELSRASAAHILVGGAPGLMGFVTGTDSTTGPTTLFPREGLCTVGRLSPQAERALSILRQSGIAPAVVSAFTRPGRTTPTPISTHDMLEGAGNPDGSGTVPFGSVKQRLVDLWGFNFDSPPTGITKPAGLADYFQLRETDFDEARTYLDQEYAAFARATDVRMQGSVLAGGRTAVFPVFPATANPPSEHPAAFWGALARYTAPDADVTANWVQDNVSALLDVAYAGAAEILAGEGNLSSVDLRQATTTPLASLLIAEERRARVTLSTDAQDNVTYSVQWVRDSTEPVALNRPIGLAFGDGDMRCAVYGNNDGGPCTNNEPPVELELGSGSGFTVAMGFDVASRTAVAVGYGTQKRIYLVRRKAGTAAGPGAYDVLMGMPLPARGQTASFNYVPDFEQRVDDILAPSTHWCAHPSVSCAHTKFDMRLPLEDELSNDSNGIESSWKHYLALATQAAAEADALGNEYVQHAIEWEQHQESIDLQEDQRTQVAKDRAVAAIDELQGICGTTLDPLVLLNFLQKGTDRLDLDFLHDSTRSCTADSDCAVSGQAAGSTKCIVGKCVFNPAMISTASAQASADLKRLADCLNAPVAATYVHLGEDDPTDNPQLCVWQMNGDPRRVCEKPAGSTSRCPIKTKDCRAFDNELPAGARWVPVTRGLDLMATASLPQDMPRDPNATTPGTPVPELGACETIRRYRDNLLSDGERAGAAALVADSMQLHETNARARVHKLGFEARFGTHGAITYAQVARYATGNAWSGGLKGAWPCRADGEGDPSPQPRSLFGTRIDCSDEGARARMVDRMARAVIAAGASINTDEWLTWPVDGFPSYRLFRVPDQIAMQPAFLGSFIWPRLLPSNFMRLGASTARTMAGGYPVDEYEAISSDASFKAYGDVTNSSVVPFQWRVHPGDSLTWSTFGDIASMPMGAQGIAPPWRVAFLPNMPADLDPARVPELAAKGPGYWWSGLGDGRESGYFRRYLEGVEPPEGGLLTGDIIDTQCDPSGLYAEVQRNCLRSHHGHYGEIQFRYESQAMLDGFELLCALSEPPAQSKTCDVPPVIDTVDDLPAARDYLECIGEKVKGLASRTILYNFPTQAMDPLRQNSAVGSFPAVGGEQAVDISALRNALVELTKVPDLMAGEIKTVASQIDGVYLAVRKALNGQAIGDVQFESTMLDQTANCARSLASLASVHTLYSPGSVPAAAITCTNAMAQIGLAKTINELMKRQEELGVEFSLNTFAQQFAASVTTITGYAKRLVQATEDIDSNLARIELQRSRAKLALSRALYVNAFESQAQTALSAALWKRYLGTTQRYENAYAVAQKMAFLAKRAIELRLGLHLDQMTTDLPLVTAPSKWESSICTSTGINWDALKKADNTPSAVDPTVMQYTDAFIGDYVKKLANVVESYRLLYNFHEGSDTTVLSLRDDVQKVRTECEVESSNLLYQSSYLDRLPASSTPGWARMGCAIPTAGDAGVPVDGGSAQDARAANAWDASVPSDAAKPADATMETSVTLDAGRLGELAGCLDITEEQPAADAAAVALPFAQDALGLADARAYRLHWGTPSAEAMLAQDVVVTGGRYRASIYVRLDHPYSDYGAHVVGVNPDISPTIVHKGTTGTTSVGDTQWTRYYEIVDVPAPTTLRFQMSPPSLTTIAPTPFEGTIVLAAPMFEKIETAVVLPERDAAAATDPSVQPRPYEGTGQTRKHWIPTCEDTSGDVFRLKGWHRGSDLLCPDGFSGHCLGTTATKYDYWETTFDLHQSDIEAGRTIGHAGFARGNFNYRIDSIIVNFVGTDVRNCSGSSSPTSCYAAGNVPYTLIHNGPYYVRNHMGQDFEAQLFTGRIENARGLATERYVTNPMSNADRDLLKDYTRLELQGRPLDGNFVLRVWDTPGVDFNAIKDVQVVLNYRYWTRFQ